MRYLIAFVVLVAWVGMIALSSCGGCSTEVLSEETSPDGTQKAVVLARTCGSAAGLVVAIGPSQFDATNDVFQVMLPSSEWPEDEKWQSLVRVEWTDPHVLHVSHPSDLEVTLKTVKRGFVEIAYQETPAVLRSGARKP